MGHCEAKCNDTASPEKTRKTAKPQKSWQRKNTECVDVSDDYVMTNDKVDVHVVVMTDYAGDPEDICIHTAHMNSTKL